MGEVTLLLCVFGFQKPLHFLLIWRRSRMQNLRFCRHCKIPISGRPNKKFCSSNCRKRFSEVIQNSFESREKKKRNYVLFDSAARLAKIYVQHSPFERLGLMQNTSQWQERVIRKCERCSLMFTCGIPKMIMEILTRVNEGGAMAA